MNKQQKVIAIAGAALVVALILWLWIGRAPTPPPKATERVTDVSREIERLVRRIDTLEIAIREREVSAREEVRKKVGSFSADDVAAGLTELLGKSRRGE